MNCFFYTDFALIYRYGIFIFVPSFFIQRIQRIVSLNPLYCEKLLQLQKNSWKHIIMKVHIVHTLKMLLCTKKMYTRTSQIDKVIFLADLLCTSNVYLYNVLYQWTDWIQCDSYKKGNLLHLDTFCIANETSQNNGVVFLSYIRRRSLIIVYLSRDRVD